MMRKELNMLTMTAEGHVVLRGRDTPTDRGPEYPDDQLAVELEVRCRIQGSDESRNVRTTVYGTKDDLRSLLLDTMIRLDGIPDAKAKILSTGVHVIWLEMTHVSRWKIIGHHDPVMQDSSLDAWNRRWEEEYGPMSEADKAANAEDEPIEEAYLRENDPKHPRPETYPPLVSASQ